MKIRTKLLLFSPIVIGIVSTVFGISLCAKQKTIPAYYSYEHIPSSTYAVMADYLREEAKKAMDAIPTPIAVSVAPTTVPVITVTEEVDSVENRFFGAERNLVGFSADELAQLCEYTYDRLCIQDDENLISTHKVPNGVGNCQSYKKTFMDFRKITRVGSPQLNLQQSDACYTDETTGIRKVDDRYCCAVGMGFTNEIGTKLNVELESGEIIRCIVSDIKAAEHTDDSMKYQRWDGSVLEFVIDGRVFSGTEQYPEYFEGAVKYIHIVE